MQATLEPSIAAIEAATFLEKPAEFLAKLRRSAREFKFALTEADKDAIKALRRDRYLPPPKREDLIKGVRTSSRAAQYADWKKYRAEAVRWVKVVRLYEMDREWISALNPRVRKGILTRFTRDVERVTRELVPSLNKEEARRRARYRKELRIDARRKRRQFGYRGRSDGRTAYLTPRADGTWDPVAIATAEFAMLTADQAAGVANHGVRIVGGASSIPRRADPAQMSKEERDEEALLALLNGELRRFKRLRKHDGSNN